MTGRVDRSAGTGWEYERLSPLDESDMPLMQERELPPMEPLTDRSAVGTVLAIGALGFSFCVGIALLWGALEPAIK